MIRVGLLFSDQFRLMEKQSLNLVCKKNKKLCGLNLREFLDKSEQNHNQKLTKTIIWQNSNPKFGN